MSGVSGSSEDQGGGGGEEEAAQNNGVTGGGGKTTQAGDPDPKDSFAWKDNTLERELKSIRKKNQTQEVEGELIPGRGHRGGDNQALERRIDRSIGNWSSSLPKAPDQEVILLKKAREERKVRRYLDDNFQNRPELVTPDENLRRLELEEELQLQNGGQGQGQGHGKRTPYKGTGPRTKDGMPIGLRSEIGSDYVQDWYRQMYTSLNKKRPTDGTDEGAVTSHAAEDATRAASAASAASIKVKLATAIFEKGGYTSEPDLGSRKYKKYEDPIDSSPPRSPPPFKKAESRFEREQKIRVGSVDAYRPGAQQDVADPDRDKVDAPPTVSAAQRHYEKERFKVQPGPIENYGLGKGSLAEQERKKLYLHRLELNERLTSSCLEGNVGTGCAITKYSSNHSYNPLTSSKSAQNLIMSEHPTMFDFYVLDDRYYAKYLLQGAYPVTPSIKKFHMQSALKDGYESDSSLIIRRTDTPVGSQTPVEAKLDYNRIQRGGEVPKYGLRMTVPDKPKDGEVDRQEEEAASSPPPPPLGQDGGGEEQQGREAEQQVHLVAASSPGPEQAPEPIARDEEAAKEEVKKEDDKDDDGEEAGQQPPPPSPPRRGSQTSQKLKRWSKMIKYSLPSKVGSSKTTDSVGVKPAGQQASARKSLKERLTDGELAVFLRERRAVSESKFRILDRIYGVSGGIDASRILSRTKSDPKLAAKAEDGDDGGEWMAAGVSGLKKRFEAAASSTPLTSPRPPARSVGGVLSSEDSEREAGGGGRASKVRSNPDGETTSPESGVENSKSDGGGEKVKKGKRSKGGGKGKDKKEKKAKGGGKADKDKKKHSTCTACNTPDGSKGKDKKKAKKDKAAGKKSADADALVSNGAAVIAAAPSEAPQLPPYPRDDWTRPGQRSKFFQKLLNDVDGGEEGEEKENIANKSSSSERKPRSALKKSGYVPPRKSTAPVINAYLCERRIVSESVFRRMAKFTDGGDVHTLPIGVLRQGERFADSRSKFENGSVPVATFPRSVSNLERRSGYGEMHSRTASRSPEHASSAVRSSSLPRRPGSGMSNVSTKSQVDQEEYRNYVLEMLHSGQKSPRFQQLQSFYSTLDRALKLEKKSASTEIHKLDSQEVVDFDTWRRLRTREKATDELDALMSDLRSAQKRREFFFRPKEVAELRWRGDAHLRGRDRSVDCLAAHFDRIVAERGDTDEARSRVAEMNQVKDHAYKPLWRAKSVSDVKAKAAALTASAGKDAAAINNSKDPAPAKGKSEQHVGLPLQQQQQDQQQQQQQPRREKKYTTFPQIKAASQAKSRSSLTSTQVNVLKDQLNEIYGSMGSSLGGTASSARSSRSPSAGRGHIEVTVPSIRLGDVRRQLEQQRLLARPPPEKIRRSKSEVGCTTSSGSTSNLAKSASREELEQKKKLSFRIGQEIRARSRDSRETSPVMRRYLNTEGQGQGQVDFDLRDRRQPIRFSHEGGGKREPSPRTCYSLENRQQEQPATQNRKAGEDDYLLVLNHHRDDDGGSKAGEVKDVVDNWAGASNGGKAGGSKKKSSESLSSSGASASTVIHRRSGRPVEKKKRGKADVAESLAERKSVGEIRSSFENIRERVHTPTSPGRLNADLPVKELRKSFEHLPGPPPERSVFFGRADALMTNGDKRDTARKSRSLSSEKNRNVGRMSFAKKKTATSDPDLADAASGRTDPTKYARAYLALVRAGEVNARRNRFENRNGYNVGGDRASSPYRMPEVDLDYISAHLTDLSRPVIRAKEVGDVSGTKAKLQRGSDGGVDGGKFSSNNSNAKIQSKLKHICRKVGHSRILGKMVSLHQQQGSNELDRGTLDLFERAVEEKEHFRVFKSGDVESKVDKFEKKWRRKNDDDGEEEADNKEDYSELDVRYPFEPAPTFSWSGRFGPSLPRPRTHYTPAKRHSQFRSYYGYAPGKGEAGRPTGKAWEVKHEEEDEDEPGYSSLPATLDRNKRAPSPPKRNNADGKEPTYSKILPKSQRKEKERGKWNEGEVNIHYRSPIRYEQKEALPEEELRKRQESQMRDFYDKIEERKERQLMQDLENRKHHDTLLPNQKSPIPLNRYAEVDGQQNQVVSPNSTMSRGPTYKMVARALYNFQAQNHRELGFKKGDIIYIKRQVDSNWYEGERNAMVGIFPTTYVEIVTENEINTLRSNASSSLNRGRLGSPFSTSSAGGQQAKEGQAKAKFNFQAQTPMELSLVKGERVTLIRRIDRNWFEGRIGGRKGIFPASYVEVAQEPGPTTTTTPVGDAGGRTLSPKPVATPAAHGVVKNGQVAGHSANYIPPDLNIGNQGRSQFMAGELQRYGKQQPADRPDGEPNGKDEPVAFRALYNYQPQNDDEVELLEGDVVYVMEKCDDGWFVGTSQRSGIFGTFPGNYVVKA